LHYVALGHSSVLQLSQKGTANPDAAVAVPKVRRLAHHRSDAAFTEAAADCRIKSSWAVPRATLVRDGGRVLFGSTWGEHCGVEPYLIDLARVE